MAYVVTEPCIGCKYTDCVEVCPVDCFYEGVNTVVIHPDECIDCGACEPVCPTKAIFSESDLPEKWREFVDLNAKFAKEWPNLNQKRDPLPEAEQLTLIPFRIGELAGFHVEDVLPGRAIVLVDPPSQTADGASATAKARMFISALPGGPGAAGMGGLTFGGGVDVFGGTVTIADSTIDSNATTAGMGGAFGAPGTPGAEQPVQTSDFFYPALNIGISLASPFLPLPATISILTAKVATVSAEFAATGSPSLQAFGLLTPSITGANGQQLSGAVSGL